jgi:hypothetical protein
MSGLVAFHALVGPVLAALAANALLNARRWARLRPAPPPVPAPSVSVLIPARNEAGRIERCLRGWARQAYPDYEVLVYDDDSTDDTAARAAAFGRIAPIRVIRGRGLPPGWRGKPHACHRLRARARGEVLVFADADVRPAPGTLGGVVAALARPGVDALSAVPAHRSASRMVCLLVGIQNWVPLAFLPLWWPAAARRPLFAAANGQFLAMRAEVYDAVGGFAAVRGALGEDVALGRRLVRAGYALPLLDGAGLLTCRPYGGVGALWQANARNLLPVLFGSTGLLLGAVLALAALYVGPPLVLVSAALAGRAPDGPGAWLPLGEIGLAVLARALADRRAGYPSRLSALHPVAVAALVGMALDSLARWRWRHRVRWRGRDYRVGGQAA